MGVTKQFAFGRTPPILRSSGDSLNSVVPSTPPSETEELPTNQRRVRVPPLRRDPTLLLERLERISRKNIGARKMRRENNAHALQTLVENLEEGPTLPPTIGDFIPSSNSPLKKLMTNSAYMNIWQYFIEQSEEDQRRYLNEAVKVSIQSLITSHGIHFTQALAENDEEEPEPPTLSPEYRFGLIDSNLKSILKKQNTSLDLVSMLEKGVIEAFSKDKNGVYLSQEMEKFNRMLLHGISKYYLLKSKSIDVAGGRRTKIENKHKLFSRPQFSLGEFLERRRSHLLHHS